MLTGFAEATAEYERLAVTFPRLGYAVTVLPHVSLERRAELVLEALAGCNA